MRRNSPLFYRFFNTNLLIYSWSFIKDQMKFSIYKENILKPISFKWFYKTAYLIKSGLFEYNNYKSFVNSKSRISNSTLRVLKYRIIEFSFIFMFTPFFSLVFFKQTFGENLRFSNFSDFYNKKFYLRSNRFNNLGFVLLDSYSALSVLSHISTWVNIDFFFTFRIFKSFNTINVNRLKNIFFKYLPDKFVWNEICKLITCGLIDFSVADQNSLYIIALL
jgi:hypothetical protein